MRLIDANKLELDADYDDGEYWAYSKRQIDNAPTIEISHWIPASEAMPPVGKTVLVTVEADNGDKWVFCDSIFPNTWHRYCGDGRHVTAWCERPEPYTEVEHETD